MLRYTLTQLQSYLAGEFINVLFRGVKIRELIIVREIGKKYSEKTNSVCKSLKEKYERLGQPLQVGERIDTVVIKFVHSSQKQNLSDRVITLQDFAENNENYILDTQFYFQDHIMSIIKEMLDTGFPTAKTQIAAFFSQLKLQAQNKMRLNEIISHTKPHFCSQNAFFRVQFAPASNAEKIWLTRRKLGRFHKPCPKHLVFFVNSQVFPNIHLHNLETVLLLHKCYIANNFIESDFSSSKSPIWQLSVANRRKPFIKYSIMS